MADELTNAELTALRDFLARDDKAKEKALQAFREGRSKLVIDKVERLEADEEPGKLN